MGTIRSRTTERHYRIEMDLTQGELDALTHAVEFVEAVHPRRHARANADLREVVRLIKSIGGE